MDVYDYIKIERTFDLLLNIPINFFGINNNIFKLNNYCFEIMYDTDTKCVGGLLINEPENSELLFTNKSIEVQIEKISYDDDIGSLVGYKMVNGDKSILTFGTKELFAGGPMNKFIYLNFDHEYFITNAHKSIDKEISPHVIFSFLSILEF